jgi:hypothetical protein
MTSRRDFIKLQAAAGIGLSMMPSLLAADPASSITFLSPIEGDMLHRHDGQRIKGHLKTLVKVSAPESAQLTINGVRVERNGSVFTAPVDLSNYKNTIVAVDDRGVKSSVTVFWLKELADHYRLSIDDAVWFLKDIHVNRDQYKSLFENPFLKFLKSVHTAFGTKVHINIFYETEGFDLSQMTEKFKPEWKANADWLKLSFHAKAEFPDNPYRNAGYAQAKDECDAVIREIRRFAGDDSSTPITTLHWGEVPVEVSRALRDAGYMGQLCDFNVDDNLAPCSYYLTVPQRRHMLKRFVWRDNTEDIIFIKSSIILDTMKLNTILPHLDQYEKQGRKPPYVDLLIHEQYFYPYYKGYQPDYGEKVLTAVKWAVDNGYKPKFLSDCLFS